MLQTSHDESAITATSVSTDQHSAEVPSGPVDATRVSDSPDEPAVELSALWLRRSDQSIVGLLMTSFVILLGYQWLTLSHWGLKPVELTSLKPREYHYALDINKASWVEWAQLDGIGEKLARRIIEDRDQRGPFRNPADVGRVRGIGPKVLDRLLPYLHGGSERKQEPKP